LEESGNYTTANTLKAWIRGEKRRRSLEIFGPKIG